MKADEYGQFLSTIYPLCFPHRFPAILDFVLKKSEKNVNFAIFFIFFAI